MLTPNPFKPTAGKTPPILIGRDEVINDFLDGIINGPGAPERLMRITGMRGTGKTVMLNELGKVAAGYGWRIISEVATPGFLGRILETLLPRTRVRGVRAQPSFAGMSIGGIEVERASLDLRDAMSRCAQKNGCGLLILLDEVQDAQLDEIRELAVSVQHLIGKDENIAFVFAGLPSMIDSIINGKTLTFLRRALPYDLGPVPIAEVSNAYEQTIRESGLAIDPTALRMIADASRGYPFMIQLVGYYTWQHAYRRDGNGATIGEEDAEKGISRARERYDATVIEPALQPLSPSAIHYLLAMSEDGDAPSSTSKVAARLGRTASSVSATRAKLIHEDYLSAPRRGIVAFTMPYMGEYLREHGEQIRDLLRL